MAKKYQVFISSTYTDLVDERKAVEETIIRAGDIPVGMEAFPAADDEQFEFIKTVIDSCDYYLLIIAGRYGSVADDGKSYTEKEFIYAVEKSIPVLVFVHADPGSLPANKSEKSEEGRRKLDDFTKLASTKRIRKTWENLHALKLAVREALDHAKATKPRPGWIRGDAAASETVIRENLALRDENTKLKAELASSAMLLDFEPAGLEERFVLHGTMVADVDNGIGFTRKETHSWEIEVELSEIFAFVAPNMRGDFIHSSLNNRVAIAALGQRESDLSYPDSVTVDADDFNGVLLQLEALGYISTSRQKTQSGRNADFSKLTEIGTQAMLKTRVRQATKNSGRRSSRS